MGEARRICHDTLQIFFEASRVSLQINANTLLPFEPPPYLGSTIAYNNSDWTAVFQNLRKAQRRWGIISKLLTKTGAKVWARRMTYKAVVQIMLLYGRKFWFFMGEMLNILEGFRHQAVRRVESMTAKCVA